jgi:Rieske Fe-S protein
MDERERVAAAGSENADAASPACACRGHLTRRDALALAVLGWGVVSNSATIADPAEDRPQVGDWLVTLDSPEPAALAPADIPLSPILAWPMQPLGNLVRSGSRLNKIVLVRLEPASLAAATAGRAADGVVAYSAICPHAGCEVNGWVAEQHIFECPCHNSRYDPSNAAAIVDGPTTRSLAALPLKIVDGKLAVAGPFAGRLGIAPT